VNTTPEHFNCHVLVKKTGCLLPFELRPGLNGFQVLVESGDTVLVIRRWSVRVNVWNLFPPAPGNDTPAKQAKCRRKWV